MGVYVLYCMSYVVPHCSILECCIVDTTVFVKYCNH